MIPLLLDLTGRRVLITGGGAVAARKAEAFVGEAEVTVVSRSFHPSLSERVRRIEADLGDLDTAALASLCEGAFLVIAATQDPSLNDRICRAASAAGALTNNASGEAGDVHLPAVARGERYVIAISTDGGSPAVSRFLREAIERCWPQLDRMIELQARLRRELRSRLDDQEQRSSRLRQVLDDREVWAALGADDAGAWKLVEGRYLHG
jgi:precorrin-2 dehydrogenase/sirohydrochlorin ferrochelatase